MKGILEKAHEIEEKAVKSYTDSVGRLKGQGLSYTDVEKVVSVISIETIIHKHLTKAMYEALREIEKIEKEYEGVEVKEVAPTPEQKTIIRRIAEMHLDIEKEMINTYRELAEKLKYPVLKALAEALAENEIRHHQELSKLIEKYK